MENQRLILFIALSFVIFLLFDAWQQQYGPKPVADTSNIEAPANAEVPAVPQTVDAPTTVTGDTSKDVPEAASLPGDSTAPAKPAAAMPVKSQKIVVQTDLLRVEIDTKGGDISKASLLAYPEQLSEPDKPVVLFNDRMPKFFVAQSGLLGSTKVDHLVLFHAEDSQYQLDDGVNSISVPLVWQNDAGLKVTKTYTFHRDSYVIDSKVEVNNGSAEPWQGRLYRQLQRSPLENQSSFIYTYTGGIVSSPETPYEKVEFDDMATWKSQQRFITGGWTAMIQHYFIGAWIPHAEESNYYYSNAVDVDSVEGGRYIIGMQSGKVNVASGSAHTFNDRLFIGPKEQDRLKATAPNLQLTVDYGILTILADPLFWLLDWIYDFIQNWGWSIVLVTLVIKLVFYKLSEAAYRSMAKMRKFQPKLQAIRERYGNDRQKMSQAMMDLYKKEKINPLGGCLPMLVQIPVFIALYWVLLESVELRQADFIFWIDDLSAKDPFYVLPLIMGASMFLQQKLNPAPMDPMQQKILMFLPVVFTLFFAFFPSGLVLYWVANNILSIIQQWYITRKIEKAPA